MNIDLGLLTSAFVFTLVPASLGLLIQLFYRRHQKNYARMWSYSWFCIAGYSLFGSFAMVVVPHLSFLEPIRLISTLVASQFGFIAMVFMLFGVFELTLRRPPRKRYRRWAFRAATAISLVAMLYLVTLSHEERLLHLGFITVHALLFAGVHIGAALFMMRSGGRRGASWLLLVVMFFLVGGFELTRMLLEVAWLNELPIEQHSRNILAFVAFLEGMFALAMIITLIDDEREAAMLAASQIEHMAYHDELTGLPNRSLFFDRLVMAIRNAERRDQKLSVFFVDIDHFKEINDTLGHSSGDALLRVAADRISSALRQEDTVARFGGDEFVGLVHGTEQAEDAIKVAHKILETVRGPFMVYGREIIVSCSIGVAIYPEDGKDAESLVKNADTAMYRAKEEGRDRYRLYTRSMNERAIERFELEMDLRQSMERDELKVFLQPMIEAESHRLRGFEALVRWEHPDHGLLTPDMFLPLAERSGQIIQIGRWVFDEVCRIASEWPESLSKTRLCVNFSAPELLASDLIPWLRSRVESCRIEPGRFEIEVTETAAFRDEQRTVEVLKAIKAFGMRIAIDDFGTGFSSLTYVRNFPLDTLKLDRMFLRDLRTGRDAQIASAVIALAHGLGLEVVAEGVEDESQKQFLSEMNCDSLQGYLFSRPFSAEQVEEKGWTEK